MALVISVFNPSGGAGCTTLTSVLGRFFSDSGNRVLMVDLDPLGVLSRMYIDRMGLTMGTPVTNALFSGNTVKPGRITKNLHLVRSSLDLWRSFSVLSEKPDFLNSLRCSLKEVDGKYDLIVIDCPPSIDILSLNAISVSHRIVMPVNARTFASMLIDEVQVVCHSLFSSLSGITDIFLNFYDPRETLCRQSFEFLRENYGSLIMRANVRRSVFVSESANLGLDIQEYKPDSSVLCDYIEVCRELFNRTENNTVVYE